MLPLLRIALLFLVMTPVHVLAFEYPPRFLPHLYGDNSNHRNDSVVIDHLKQLLQHQHVVFMGNSLVRYTYLSLVYALKYRAFNTRKIQPNIVQEKTWRDWSTFYAKTNALLAPEFCDCFRVPKDMHNVNTTENRFYYDTQGQFNVSYFQYFERVVKGHWHPTRHASDALRTLNYNKNSNNSDNSNNKARYLLNTNTKNDPNSDYNSITGRYNARSYTTTNNNNNNDNHNVRNSNSKNSIIHNMNHNHYSARKSNNVNNNIHNNVNGNNNQVNSNVNADQTTRADTTTPNINPISTLLSSEEQLQQLLGTPVRWSETIDDFFRHTLPTLQPRPTVLVLNAWGFGSVSPVSANGTTSNNNDNENIVDNKQRSWIASIFRLATDQVPLVLYTTTTYGLRDVHAYEEASRVYRPPETVFQLTRHAEEAFICSLPKVLCVDHSWTKHAPASDFWDNAHFQAEVYTSMIEQLLLVLMQHQQQVGGGK